MRTESGAPFADLLLYRFHKLVSDLAQVLHKFPEIPRRVTVIAGFANSCRRDRLIIVPASCSNPARSALAVCPVTRSGCLYNAAWNLLNFRRGSRRAVCYIAAPRISCGSPVWGKFQNQNDQHESWK